MWPKGHVKRGKNTAYDEFWDAFNLSLDGCFIEVRIFFIMLSPNLAPFPPCLCGYEHSMICKKMTILHQKIISFLPHSQKFASPTRRRCFSYLSYIPSCLLMCSASAWWAVLFILSGWGGRWSVYCGVLLKLAWLVSGESLPLRLPPVFRFV